jgi:hypothetical protein
MLHLVIKVGLAFVALCCLASSVAVALAASYQAKTGVSFLRVSDAPCSNATDEVFEQTAAFNDKLNMARFAGHTCELAAAVVVILLYAAVGCMGFSIVSSARKKIDASRAKLQQLQTTIGSQHEAKAAAAGTATKIALARVSRASARVARVCACVVTPCCSVERAARRHGECQREDAAAGCVLLHRRPRVCNSGRLRRLRYLRQLVHIF